MSKLSQLENVLEKLGEAGESVGFGDDLFNFGAELYESIDKGLSAWANNCEIDWKDNAPWNTENLRDSISSEVDFEKLQAWVGVDRGKLLARAGQELPFKRVWYKTDSTIAAGQEMPDYDYTEEADSKNAKSAGGQGARGVIEPPEPGSHTPFINEIWFVLADKNKEEIFGNA